MTKAEKILRKAQKDADKIYRKAIVKLDDKLNDIVDKAYIDFDKAAAPFEKELEKANDLAYKIYEKAIYGKKK